MQLADKKASMTSSAPSKENALFVWKLSDRFLNLFLRCKEEARVNGRNKGAKEPIGINEKPLPFVKNLAGGSKNQGISPSRSIGTRTYHAKDAETSLSLPSSQRKALFAILPGLEEAMTMKKPKTIGLTNAMLPNLFRKQAKSRAIDCAPTGPFQGD